jgi:hypothetical protein
VHCVNLLRGKPAEMQGLAHVRHRGIRIGARGTAVPQLVYNTPIHLPGYTARSWRTCVCVACLRRLQRDAAAWHVHFVG